MTVHTPRHQRLNYACSPYCPRPPDQGICIRLGGKLNVGFLSRIPDDSQLRSLMLPVDFEPSLVLLF